MHIYDSSGSPSPEYKLRPHGQGFVLPPLPAVGIKQKGAVNAQACRCAFLSLCGLNHSRYSVLESKLICKTKFILSRNPRAWSDELLISLLADQNILFSRCYQVYSTDHTYYRSHREDLPTSSQEQRDEIRDKILSPLGDRKEQYGKVLSMIQEKAAAARNPVRSYRDILIDYLEPDGAKVLEKLREWDKDVSLTEKEAIHFVCNVLFPYCAAMESQLQLIKAAGHYSPPVTENLDGPASNYLSRQQCLQQLLTLRNTEPVPYEPFPLIRDIFIDWSDPSPTHLPNCTYTDLCNATTEYFLKLNHADPKITQDAVRYVDSALRVSIDGNQKLLPFSYLLACILGGERLFSQAYTINLKRFEDFPVDFHPAKPIIAKQRIARMQLLHALFDIYCTPPADQCKNWNCFFQFHTISPQSAVEFRLLAEYLPPLLIDQNCSGSNQFYRASFAALLQRLLPDCIPIEPDTQFSYRATSPLHLGGYATFLTQYPHVLEACTTRILRNPSKWEVHLDEYLAHWSAPVVDFDAVRSLLHTVVLKWRWAHIPHASTNELSLFCSENFRSTNCVDELKMLLLESAMRTVLAKRASEILYKQVQNIFGLTLAL